MLYFSVFIFNFITDVFVMHLRPLITIGSSVSHRLTYKFYVDSLVITFESHSSTCKISEIFALTTAYDLKLLLNWMRWYLIDDSSYYFNDVI